MGLAGFAGLAPPLALPKASSMFAVSRDSCQAALSWRNSIGKVKLPGLAGFDVVTLIDAKASPGWRSDQRISVAVNVSGVKPPSRSAAANLSMVAASSGVVDSTSCSLSAPLTAGSASR
ncbi:hypothetical protein MycrhDRAFT_7020 [Mycolicibacterium rhodesiae JS60]|nr:hypothetical protein MycrhDRAFT_7020 [Mycolicibacterium rhodesiae JS60]